LFTVAGFGVVGLLAVMSGCAPPKPGIDTTPPGFLPIRADHLRVSDGLNTGSEIILVSGFKTTNLIGRDRSLRLVVSVGDTSEVSVSSAQQYRKALEGKFGVTPASTDG
jgi:hypothetical protein